MNRFLEISRNKVGIVGYGITGSQHIAAIKAIPEIQLCGIVGRNIDKLAKVSEKHKTNYFRSLSEMYEKEEPRFLVICLPILEVKSVIEIALQFPWEILVEKPLGLNFEQNSEILAEIKRKSRKVFVGMNRRMLESVLSLRFILEEIQGPRIIEVVDQQDVNSAKEMGFPKQVIENWHQANSVHMMDLGLNFVRDTGYDSINEKSAEIFTNEYRYSMSFGSGDSVYYSSIWNEERRWSITIKAEQHEFLLKPIEKLHILCRCCAEFNRLNLYGEPPQQKPGFYNQLSAFAGVRPELKKYLCSPDQANLTSRILSDIYGS